MNRNTRRQTGFTLVEVLIPVAVAAVLLGSALPSLQTMTQRHRLEGSAAQLETDLQLARSAAVAANAVLRMDFSARILDEHGNQELIILEPVSYTHLTLPTNREV